MRRKMLAIFDKRKLGQLKQWGRDLRIAATQCEACEVFQSQLDCVCVIRATFDVRE